MELEAARQERLHDRCGRVSRKKRRLHDRQVWQGVAKEKEAARQVWQGVRERTKQKDSEVERYH
jgi:hypothetical protein